MLRISALFLATVTAYQPLHAPAGTSCAMHARRTRSVVALAEVTSLLADTAVVMPAGFEQFAPMQIPRFGDAMMNAVGTYVLFSGAHTFGKVGLNKYVRKDKAVAEILAAVRAWSNRMLLLPIPSADQAAARPHRRLPNRTSSGIMRTCDHHFRRSRSSTSHTPSASTPKDPPTCASPRRQSTTQRSR